MAQQTRALNAQQTTQAEALDEIIRLRAWLHEISNCKGENTLAEQFARRIRYIARRALAGDAV